jgi:chaperonin GroEL (HSP60 family)
MGFDITKGAVLVENGTVIDPTKVVKNSLLYGASAASMLLTVDAAVIPDLRRRSVLIEHETIQI